MHDSVMAFMGRWLTRERVEGKRVLEVGSYDVNGSVRPLALRQEPAEYIGVDMREGPGVDQVVDARKLVEHFDVAQFDIVICAEMLEHAEDWREVVDNLKSVLKREGLLLLTTRSEGFPLHGYPDDYWRFSRADMLQIFADFKTVWVEGDPQVPGVFVAAQNRTGRVALADVPDVFSMKPAPAPSASKPVWPVTAEEVPRPQQKWAVVILGEAPHREGFREVAEALNATLLDLGRDSVLETGFFPEGRRAIVLGARGTDTLPRDAIIYNLEQVGSPWFTTELVALYAKHTVWDYSEVNAQRFTELGGAIFGNKTLTKPVVVPFGYHPCLTRIERKPEHERDIDVLHIGSVNERRQKLLKKLDEMGHHVVALFGMYGVLRDTYLARAKVVINPHFYEDSAIYEQARANYCIANNVSVVSEESADPEASVCALHPYEDLVLLTDLLVREPGVRQIREHDAFERLRDRPMRRYVQHALAMLGWADIAPFLETKKDALTGIESLFHETPSLRLLLRQRIVLCMIVKNESKVIRRCLESVKGFITDWCIVDTGSTDGTQDIVREFMADIPGELLEQRWEREDKNRTQAISAARKIAPDGYIFWIDADEVFSQEPGFVLPRLVEDSYDIDVRYGAVTYARLQLLKASLPWRWIGRVHPYLQADGSKFTGKLTGVYTTPYPDGASWSDPDKYKKHVVLLKQDLKDDPHNARARYYLAQSYRDCGEQQKALENYRLRAKMSNGWEEERWRATYEAAKLVEKLKRPVPEVVTAYVESWRERPTRAEPLHALARYLNWAQQPAAALMFARQAALTPYPPDRLQVEPDVYLWRALDELSLAAIQSGHVEEAREAFRALMRVAPPHAMERLLKNAVHIDPERTY